jgi:flagellar motor component MotA
MATMKAYLTENDQKKELVLEDVLFLLDDFVLQKFARELGGTDGFARIFPELSDETQSRVYRNMSPRHAGLLRWKIAKNKNDRPAYNDSYKDWRIDESKNVCMVALSEYPPYFMREDLSFEEIPDAEITEITEFEEHGKWREAESLEEDKKSPGKKSLAYMKYVCCAHEACAQLASCSIKARREGLLALEDDLKEISDDFLKCMLRLVIDGSDLAFIREIAQIKIDHEGDYYRRRLMRLIMDGAIAVGEGMEFYKLLLVLNAASGIQESKLDKACTSFLSGDIDALLDFEFDPPSEREMESEELVFIKRAIMLGKLSRDEGLFALEAHIDKAGIAAHDVFEYGLPLIIDGVDTVIVRTILENFVEQENDPVRRNLARAKKDAISAIAAGNNNGSLTMKLFSYFDDSIAAVVRREMLEE